MNALTLPISPLTRNRLEIRLRIRAFRRQCGISLPLTGAAFLALRRKARIDLGRLAYAFDSMPRAVVAFESEGAAPPPGLRPLLGEWVR
jgi:hypothetical protein